MAFNQNIWMAAKEIANMFNALFFSQTQVDSRVSRFQKFIKYKKVVHLKVDKLFAKAKIC